MNNSQTPTESTTIDPEELAEPATVETLRAAMASFDAMQAARKETLDAIEPDEDAATDSLASVTLSRYRTHIAPYVQTFDGVEVLNDNVRKLVVTLLWLDATGSAKAPKASDRTPSERTFSQYVARFGTVATDLMSGTACLSSPETAKHAYLAILQLNRDFRQASAEREAIVAGARDHAAFLAYLRNTSQPNREAFERVISLCRGDASPYLGAFIAALPAPTELA